MELQARKEELHDAKLAFERARRKGADVWHDTKKYFYAQRQERAELAEKEFIARNSRIDQGDFEL